MPVKRANESDYQTLPQRPGHEDPRYRRYHGKAVALSLTSGQRAHITEAEPLLDEVDPEAFIADKTYDADPLIEKFEEREIIPVIPSNKNRIRQRKIRFSIYA